MTTVLMLTARFPTLTFRWERGLLVASVKTTGRVVARDIRPFAVFKECERFLAPKLKRGAK